MAALATTSLRVCQSQAPITGNPKRPYLLAGTPAVVGDAEKQAGVTAGWGVSAVTPGLVGSTRRVLVTVVNDTMRCGPRVPPTTKPRHSPALTHRVRLTQGLE